MPNEVQITEIINELELIQNPNTLEIQNNTHELDITVTPNEIVLNDTTTVLEVSNPSTTLEVNSGQVEVLTLGEQGPRGVPEDEVAFAKRTDFTTNDTIIYKGVAVPGTLDAESLWRVRRLTLAGDDDVTEEWANGNSNFTNSWTNRLSETYS